MKKLVAFAMILSLGMFCTFGCGPAPKKPEPPKKPPVEKQNPDKPAPSPEKTK